MNILQLCNGPFGDTNLSKVMKHFNHNIVNKYKPNNISVVSYDAFIITVDFITKHYKTNESFFNNLTSQQKNIIYVYNYNNTLENDYGLKYLSSEYNINFKNMDCSVLETHNWNYKPSRLPGIYDSGTALSMSSTSLDGYCRVKATKQFYIMKKNNIVIMHDLQITYYGKSQLDVSRMPKMIDFILQFNEENSKEVDWLDNINILDDDVLLTKFGEKCNKIEKLKQDLENINSKIKRNNFYKSILYSNGNELVNVVKVILEEMLETTISDMDLKKQDLYFVIDNINVLVEVKGINHGFKRDNIAQAKRHVMDFAKDKSLFGSDRDRLCKGVLIVNPYDLSNLDEKISKEFYSKDVMEDAKYDNICTLDTLTLLNYYSKWKKDSSSIDIKNILLNTNYNEPNYDEIIRKAV